MAKDKNNDNTQASSSGFSRRANLSSNTQPTPTPTQNTQPASNFQRRGVGLAPNQTVQPTQAVQPQPQTQVATGSQNQTQSQSGFGRRSLGAQPTTQLTQNVTLQPQTQVQPQTVVQKQTQNQTQTVVQQSDTQTTLSTEATTPQPKPTVRNLTSPTLGGTSQTVNPFASVNETSILNQEAITVGDDKPKKEKKKKKHSKLWIKIIIFFVAFCIFFCACAVAVYSIYQLVKDMNSDKVLTKIEINIKDDMEYKIKECKFLDSESTEYTTENVSKKDLSFYWVNNSKKTYELQITFDKNQYFRFSQYNIYNSLYTSESIFKVDFETLTPNFASKFVLREDGYYYLDKKSQISNQVTLIFSVEFNVPDYRQQFDGSEVREVIKIEQSANPNVDWGYYPYLF